MFEISVAFVLRELLKEFPSVEITSDFLNDDEEELKKAIKCKNSRNSFV